MKAYELIELGWTQYTNARDKDGNSVVETNSKAISFCVMGAIYKCYSDPLTQMVAVEKLHKYLSCNSYGRYSIITSWNDSMYQTKDNVLNVLKFLDI